MAKACGKTMAAVFASREEEMTKKTTEKAKKALTASLACQRLPDESKEHVAKACESCLGQRSKADPVRCGSACHEQLRSWQRRVWRRLCRIFSSSSLSCAWGSC